MVWGDHDGDGRKGGAKIDSLPNTVHHVAIILLCYST